MKYCLLIHISRDFISFSYNKEGDKGFIPYGEEPVKPLAVYCQGNEISIGTFALSEAQKGNKYAHANLFDAMSSTELIEYKGQKHDINKLLFFAMEKYVAEFFDKILMRSEGSLEDNRAHFPVVVLFNPDLRFHERDHVVRSLIDGGYGNLWKTNASDILEEVACSKMDAGTIPIFVGGDGYNLYCESKKAKLSEIVTMEKVAMDPRIDRAMGITWADILHQGYDEYRYDKDSDLSVLRKCTTDFLRSSKREQTSSVVLSDGLTYDIFLKRSDFGMSSGNVSEEAMVAFSKFKNLLEMSGTQASQCCIVLTEREVATEYVENLFLHYFPNVIGITDEQRYIVLQKLAKKVSSMGYKFPQEDDRKEILAPPPIPGPPSIPVAEKTPENNQNVKDAIRKAKMLLRSYKNRTDKAEIVKEMKELMEPLQRNGQNDIANELKQVIETIRVEAPKPPIIKQNNIKFKREVGILCNSVKHMNSNEAIKKIDDLLKRLHDEGISEYDKRLESLRTNLKPTPPPIPTPPKQASKVEPVKAPPPSPSEISKLKREAKMAIHKSGISKKELTDLLDKLHSIGLHDYDTDLNAAIKKIK